MINNNMHCPDVVIPCVITVFETPNVSLPDHIFLSPHKIYFFILFQLDNFTCLSFLSI